MTAKRQRQTEGKSAAESENLPARAPKLRRTEAPSSNVAPRNATNASNAIAQCATVAEFLSRMQLQGYTKHFVVDHGLTTVSDLAKYVLSEDDLREIGVHALGHRRALMQMIQKHRRVWDVTPPAEPLTRGPVPTGEVSPDDARRTVRLSGPSAQPELLSFSQQMERFQFSSGVRGRGRVGGAMCASPPLLEEERPAAAEVAKEGESGRDECGLLILSAATADSDRSRTPCVTRGGSALLQAVEGHRASEALSMWRTMVVNAQTAFREGIVNALLEADAALKSVEDGLSRTMEALAASRDATIKDIQQLRDEDYDAEDQNAFDKGEAAQTDVVVNELKKSLQRIACDEAVLRRLFTASGGECVRLSLVAQCSRFDAPRPHQRDNEKDNDDEEVMQTDSGSGTEVSEENSSIMSESGCAMAALTQLPERETLRTTPNALVSQAQHEATLRCGQRDGDDGDERELLLDDAMSPLSLQIPVTSYVPVAQPLLEITSGPLERCTQTKMSEAVTLSSSSPTPKPKQDNRGSSVTTLRFSGEAVQCALNSPVANVRIRASTDVRSASKKRVEDWFESSAPVVHRRSVQLLEHITGQPLRETVLDLEIISVSSDDSDDPPSLRRQESDDIAVTQKVATTSAGLIPLVDEAGGNEEGWVGEHISCSQHPPPPALQCDETGPSALHVWPRHERVSQHHQRLVLSSTPQPQPKQQQHRSPVVVDISGDGDDASNSCSHDSCESVELADGSAHPPRAHLLWSSDASSHRSIAEECGGADMDDTSDEAYLQWLRDDGGESSFTLFGFGDTGGSIQVCDSETGHALPMCVGGDTTRDDVDGSRVSLPSSLNVVDETEVSLMASSTNLSEIFGMDGVSWSQCDRSRLPRTAFPTNGSDMPLINGRPPRSPALPRMTQLSTSAVGSDMAAAKSPRGTPPPSLLPPSQRREGREGLLPLLLDASPTTPPFHELITRDGILHLTAAEAMEWCTRFGCITYGDACPLAVSDTNDDNRGAPLARSRERCCEALLSLHIRSSFLADVRAAFHSIPQFQFSGSLAPGKRPRSLSQLREEERVAMTQAELDAVRKQIRTREALETTRCIIASLQYDALQHHAERTLRSHDDDGVSVQTQELSLMEAILLREGVLLERAVEVVQRSFPQISKSRVEAFLRSEGVPLETPKDSPAAKKRAAFFTQKGTQSKWWGKRGR